MDLPCGNLSVVFDTAIQSSFKLSTRKEYNNRMESTNTRQFKYLQENYGDFCTLINVINVLHYIQDHHSKVILVPHLNVKAWKEYVTQISQHGGIGFEVGHLMRLLREKFGCTTLKHDNQDILRRNLLNQVVFRVNSMHAISIYNNILFDANNSSMVT